LEPRGFTMNNVSTLNWQQRLAIISKLAPTDERASKVFGVSVDEINTARDSITADENFDVTPFASQFTTTATTTTTTTTATSTATGIKKKRGRTGSRVINAFANVSSTPVALADFATANNVSENVLRQVKRFTHNNQGTVLPQFEHKTIRVGKRDGTSCIWLDEVSA